MAPSHADYVELRCASAFSFLEGASNPEDLVERAAELGHTTLALADRAGLYGIPRFHQAAATAGLTPRVGAVVPIRVPDLSLLLLVSSRRGWRNLCRLLTAAHAHGPRGAPTATWEELEAHAAGLVGLARGDAFLSPEALDRALGTLERGALFVDISRHRDRTAAAAARRATALAEACRVPILASQDVRAARPEGRRVLDVFACLRAGTSLDRAGRRLAPNAERHLLAPAEMAARFADRPAWVRTTRAVAERCAFTLRDLGYRFPSFPVPPGHTQGSWLRRLVHEGARRRYGGPLPARVHAQLAHELAVIEKLGLAGYFLIVHDITRFAREQGILAQGRGSAANSAVCYALGVTAVDPIGMELLFERFLSQERGEWPDIDLDLPSGAKRERVIQYVFERYGARGAAMTATVITYRTRLAVREAGKALGLEPELVERVSRILATLEHREDLDEPRALLRQGGVDPDAPRVAALLELCERMHGLPRHLGQHTGGIVVAAGRLDEVVPIEPAAMPGRRVIQWDKDDCADLGLIKIDLLGLGMLAALEETIRLARTHEGVDLDLARLPPDDPETFAGIRRADTVGVFQIESRAQMATLPRLRPERFYDLVVEVAIIRPGPIVGRLVHPYLARRAGREPVRYPHPALEPILRRTLGVPLFQEQLLRIAMTAAGFTGGEAEELRRAMGFKRSRARMARLEARLRAGMQARGIRGDAQEEIARGITSFALYGFPESHAASFALLAYASAYLKTHHPAAFLAGILNAWPMGFYGPATLVADAQRHGVVVRPIDAVRSEWLCTLEPLDDSPGLRAVGSSRSFGSGVDCAAGSSSDACGGARPLGEGTGVGAPEPKEGDEPAAQATCHPFAVRLGLRFVGGLREDAGRRLVEARHRAPFAGVADLARRAGLQRAEGLALAELGALAAIDPAARTRRAALWQVAALERDPRSLFAGVAPPPGSSPLPETTPLEDTLADYRTSGVTTGPHVMAYLRPRLAARGILSAAQLRRVENGRFVRTAGHVIVRQRPGTAKGTCFLTLEDETGTANAVLTPAAFRRLRVALHAAALVELAGPIESVDGVTHVRVRELRPLVTGDALPPSHDYR